MYPSTDANTTFEQWSYDHESRIFIVIFFNFETCTV